MVREYEQKEKLRVAALRINGVVDPSPACIGAVDQVVTALKKDGHQVVDIEPLSAYEALRIALLKSDGWKFKTCFRTGEWEDRGAKQPS